MSTENIGVSGTERFYQLLVSSILPDTQKILREHEEGLKDILKDRLFGDGDVPMLKRSPKRSEEFRFKMVNLMAEVTAALQMLQDIPIYLKRFPFAKDKTSKLRYLRHHVEFYYNQIYVLQERLKKYFIFIERSYKNPETKHISDTAIFLKEQVCNYIHSIIATRGAHIHEEQYDDTDFYRLCAVEFFVKHGQLPAMQKHFNDRYRKARREWIKIISESLTRIEKMLDTCFGELAPLLNSGNGKLLLPQNHR